MLESMEQWRKQKAMEMEEQERLAAAAAAEAKAKAKVKIEQADDEKASTTKRKRRRRTGVSWSTKTTKRRKPTTTTDASDSPPLVTVIDLDLNDDETVQVVDAGVVAASSSLRGLDLSQDEISACLAAEENDITPQPSPPAPAAFPILLSESQEAAKAVCELATSAREEEEMKRAEAEVEATLALATATTATTAKGEKAILKEPKSEPRLFTSLVLQDKVECDDGEDWYAARPHMGSEAENGKEEEVEEDSNSVGLRMQLYGEDEPYVVNPHERGNISRFVNVCTPLCTVELLIVFDHISLCVHVCAHIMCAYDSIHATPTCGLSLW